MFGDEVERLQQFDPLTGELIADDLEHVAIWPATHYNVKEGTIEDGVAEIGRELNERCEQLESEGKQLESHRLRQRTQYDMEMLREVGFCSGIENYSRILDGRAPGERPYCLIDYFPKDFICFIDESHQTVPQIGGMFEGDRSRKQTLVDYGFRLPSALDNRPQTFDEFLSITPQLLFVSATPGRVRAHAVDARGRADRAPDGDRRSRSSRCARRSNQIDDLMNEVRMRVERDERVLVTTLTKKMSEDLSQYLLEMGFKTRYLHSEIDTLERIQIIRDLRLGEYDVLVGVNLLREGLDLPEVSLVAILDADKEGFLRGETSLIQTIGRAARNVDGTVLMYADKETRAMRAAISETDRRREIQLAYNEQHGITAATIVKGISDIAEFLQAESKVPRRAQTRAPPGARAGQEMPQARARADGGRAGGGDGRGGRRSALRVRRSAARRAARAAPRPAGDRPRRARRTPRGGSRQRDPDRRHRLGCPPWTSTGRQSNAGTSRSAGADTTRRRSTPTCVRWPRSSSSCSARARAAAPTYRSPRPPEPRSRASCRRPRRPPRKSSATRSTARARCAKRPTGTPSGPARKPSSGRAHTSRRSRRSAAGLLERVGSMDGEVSALVESLRSGAGRLAADLAAVETGMGELYDAASGRASAAAEPEPAAQCRAASRPTGGYRAPRGVSRRARRCAGSRARAGRQPAAARGGRRAGRSAGGRSRRAATSTARA